jgi:hypothetical protein
MCHWDTPQPPVERTGYVPWAAAFALFLTRHGKGNPASGSGERDPGDAVNLHKMPQPAILYGSPLICRADRGKTAP